MTGTHLAAAMNGDATAPKEKLTLMHLPPELRERIWEEVLAPELVITHLQKWKYSLKLLATSRQIYQEAKGVFRRANIFAKVETPWAEAQHHISVEGHVPLVATNPFCQQHGPHHLVIRIDAPDYPELALDSNYQVVVRIQDIPAFASMWAYSDLSHPGLNANLRLTLGLRDPYATEFSSDALPKALQCALLLPWGRVKGLAEVVVEGNHLDSIVKEMRENMAVPYKQPEECLEDCIKYKDEGNVWLHKEQYDKAIESYREAFKAIHIVVDGRQRDVWGEVFFRKELMYGQYEGEYGHMVCLGLRVKLVANMMLAYIKKNEWEEVFFWGMRSITLMRNTIGDGGGDPDEPVLNFGATGATIALGKIYYRTGLAAKHLGEDSEARSLLRVARNYLPDDEAVQRECASVALQIG